MLTLDQFRAKWNGKGIDFDGAYGDQCMDLMHQYCVEVLGITNGAVLAAPAAKDVYLNFSNVTGHELFDKIDNTPTGVPQAGDIVFWGTGIGPYGHVAVFVQGDVNSFRSFDQNFPTGSVCHDQNHSDYTGVLGWLRFKQAPSTDTISIPKTKFEELVGKSTKYDAFVAAGYNSVDDVKNKIADMQKLVDGGSTKYYNLKQAVQKTLDAN
jgi:hypothetical protein